MKRMDTIIIKTHEKTELMDITDKIQEVVAKTGIQKGICTVFVPHTTAGITINENADPSVKRDILLEMNKLIPLQDGYLHMEGNSAAHIKASLFGFSETIIIEKGVLQLGTWQGIYFSEFDGPRTRKVWVQVSPSS